MRRHMVRALLATVAAGASVLLITGASTASTATARPAVGGHAVVTTSQAGYVAVGQHFRFATATVVVPPKAAYDHYAEVVLGGPGVIPATLGVRAGGGTGSIRWNVLGPITDNMAGGTVPVFPRAGDQVRLSIYFNQGQGRDYFTAADLTRHSAKTLAVPAPAHVVYTAAEVACLLPAAPAAPKADRRLWEFGNIAVTTYSGIRGTMVNPMWTTREIIDVTAGGRVVMSPWHLWNSGHNFGAWLRAAR